MPSTPRQPVWLDAVNCGVCLKRFDLSRLPCSLSCGHSICFLCLSKLNPGDSQTVLCPLDQTLQKLRITEIPINVFILNLLEIDWCQSDYIRSCMKASKKFLEGSLGASVGKDYETVLDNLDQFSKLLVYSQGLNKALQRKLLALLQCQIAVEEGRTKALRAARSLCERVVIELILQHQNQQQLTSHLWSAVRGRGCQFLGPAMQEEVLKLVLLALENGAALSRKVLVMFIVQKLKPQYQQASKTSVGHVVQLLYRASCFKVSKRDSDSSLMELKEEFCNYEALRREHDAQIIQIAQEAGLRIAPEQWSALLYGDQLHKSAMQSIIDKLQTTQFFAQSVQELMIAVQRSGDPRQLSRLRDPLDQLAHLSVDLSSNDSVDLPTMSLLAVTTTNALMVVTEYLEFINSGFAKRVRETPQQLAPQVPGHNFVTPPPAPSPFGYPRNEGNLQLLATRSFPQTHIFPHGDSSTMSVMDLNQVVFRPSVPQPPHRNSSTVVLNLSNNPTPPAFRPISRQYSAPVRSQLFSAFEQEQIHRRRLQEDFYSAQVANSSWNPEGGLKKVPGSWNDLNQLNERHSNLREETSGLHRVSSLSEDLHYLQLTKPEPPPGFDLSYFDSIPTFAPHNPVSFDQSSSNGSYFRDTQRNRLQDPSNLSSWNFGSSRNASPH